MTYEHMPRLPILTRVLPGLAIAAFTVMALFSGPDRGDRVARFEALEAATYEHCGHDAVCRLAVGTRYGVGAEAVAADATGGPETDRDAVASALDRCGGDPICELSVGVASKVADPDSLVDVR